MFNLQGFPLITLICFIHTGNNLRQKQTTISRLEDRNAKLRQECGTLEAVKAENENLLTQISMYIFKLFGNIL